MWSDIETSKDLLGFSVHASLLKEVVTNDKNLPITIGLYGDWGSGKSSVLQILKESLENDEDSIVIYFDGWSFESFDDAKMALIQGIIHELEQNEKFTSKLGGECKKLFSKLKQSVNWMRVLQMGVKSSMPVITSLVTGGTSLAPLVVNGIRDLLGQSKELLDQNKAEECIRDIFVNNNEKIEEKYKAVRDFRKDFKKLINKADKSRVIVLIDDLDRCLPRRIIDSLEAIKLFLNVDNTAFIIAADEFIVSNAIKSEYKLLIESAGKENNRNIGTAYMEKFIQLPYRLPMLSRKEVENYITLLFCQSELSKEVFDSIQSDFQNFTIQNKFEVYSWENISTKITQQNELEYLKDILGFVCRFSNIISNTLKGNPRLIKRFLNAYELRSNLLKVSNMGTHDNKFVLLKLMLLEYKYEELFQQLHEWTFANKGGFSDEIKNLEKFAAGDKTITKPEGAWSFDDVQYLLTVEPYFSSIDLRELFWVSRDKLKDVVGGYAMIPLRVKKVLSNALEAVSIPILETICKNEVASLIGDDLSSFYDLLENHILTKPKEKRGYEVYFSCIKFEIDSSYQKFIDILERLNPNDIPVATANFFKELHEKYNDNKVIEIISKNNSLKKAFDSTNF